MIKKRIDLGFYPTPLHPLENLSNSYSDFSLYMKRDDQTGLASGGNKVRKLEYLLREAIDQKYDMVLTAGAQQSNHCRQTAAACAKLGLDCHLMIAGHEPKEYSGNLLLSRLLGATIQIYTARAFGGMLDYLTKKKIATNTNVLFWHTGGFPEIFEHANELT